MPSSVQFSELAVELIIKILLHLDVQTLVSCRLVDHFLKAVIDDSVALQYKIELFAAGMEDGPACHMDIAERLKRLKGHTSAWEDLEWEAYAKLAATNLPLLDWHMHAGVLVRMCGTRGTRISLRFDRLPGYARGVQPKSWRLDNIDPDTLNFDVDIGQDLLVMASIRQNGLCYLFQMSTGKPHPSATKVAIYPLLPSMFSSVMSVTISGDYVGMILETFGGDTPGKNLRVFNWKTCSPVLWLWSNASVIESFVFLTERFVLLSICLENTWVYKVYDLENPPALGLRHEAADSFCAFLYPKHGLHLSFARVQVAPTPAWYPGEDSQVPFFPARGERVILANIEFEGTEFRQMRVDGGLRPAFDPDGRPYTHFIPASVLISRLQPGRTWEWSEWGPHGTCLQEDVGDFSAGRIVGGNRFVLPYEQDNSDDQWLEFYDFNWSQRRGFASERCGKPLDTRHGCLVHWVGEDGEEYQITTGSALPFTCKSMKLPYDRTEILRPNTTLVSLYEDGVVLYSNDGQFHVLIL